MKLSEIMESTTTKRVYKLVLTGGEFQFTLEKRAISETFYSTSLRELSSYFYTFYIQKACGAAVVLTPSLRIFNFFCHTPST